ncbi:MAG: GntR family transcriptional regulator [Lachnospiraceae bacterium]|nr:GntR family transcriptional regulator [Lachnospiraceae bacterium]
MDKINYSLGQKVFHRIREDILAGKYKSGEELKEKSIGDEIGVSRTPVREALRQLELEGLIHIIPNQGAYVVGISSQDMQDIYEMRSVLEGLCARRAASRITSLQIEIMEEVLYLAEFHMERGHMGQLVDLDSKFHEILYEAGGSRILGHALKDYHHYLERARRISLLDPKRAPESHKEHQAILLALKRQEGQKAEEAAAIHVNNTIQNIASYGWDKIETGGHGNGKN